ncbi:MAG: hypothetical protein H0W82_00630 [Actinobacteria bacterium]|nr:hypothetical protein [Actinomycetota bacterium]
MSSSPTDSPSPRAARWPWACLGVFVAVATAGLLLVPANDEAIAAQVPYVVAFMMFAVVGALIASRDRSNRIGLLLLLPATMTASSFLGGELTTWLLGRGHRGPGIIFLAFLTNFGWLLGILPVLFILPLLFPDGRLPSPRWRPFLWVVLGFLGILAVSLLLGQETLTGSVESAEIANPLYVEAVGRIPSLDPVVFASLPLLFGLSVASLFLRFRRSSGGERQQIKWVAFGLTAGLIGFVIGSFIRDPVTSAFVSGPAFLAFPISIGIAVLRFHLYELDLVMKKTVVYAALALFATLIYLGIVVGLGTWLGRGSSFFTMVAAVTVAVFFQPVRTLLTRFANRVVYGRRATPYEVLAEFSERVGGAYADDDVLPRMARVLGEGVGAERADIWLTVDRELRNVASWPSDVERSAPVSLVAGAVSPVEGADRVVAVEHLGQVLGALAIQKPASDPVSSADEKLIADLAGQAGLVLRNVRLTEELKARLADLKAAQKRLVAAQDEERRKLERNIHDGAQQQLVALSVKARLARQLTERDPPKAIEILEQIEAETGSALSDLRDLARGIYPPLLADKGLAAAVEAQARKSPVSVSMEAAGIARFPQEIEAAVYFSVLESLQNLAKYADASHATISLVGRSGSLEFTVSDDGRGFDPGHVGYGTGLQGIADRLGALDGDLQVVSRPGGGTTVTGRLPVNSEGSDGAVSAVGN